MIRTGLSDLKDGFRFMFREKPVLWKISVVFSGVGLLLTSLVLIALPVLITQRLGFAPDTANRLYGYALGVMAGGAITGGAIAGVVASKLKPQTIPFILTGCAFSVLAGGMALQMLTAPPDNICCPDPGSRFSDSIIHPVPDPGNELYSDPDP